MFSLLSILYVLQNPPKTIDNAVNITKNKKVNIYKGLLIFNEEAISLIKDGFSLTDELENIFLFTILFVLESIRFSLLFSNLIRL